MALQAAEALSPEIESGGGDEGSSPASSHHCYELQCAVTLQSSVAGKGRKSSFRGATASLGRNNFRDIVLRLVLGGDVASYLLKDVQVHQKVAAAEGKGCVAILSEKLLVLFSNAPPARLALFLSTLRAKLALMRDDDAKGTPATGRQRLLSGLPVVFEALSPLSFAEIRRLRAETATATRQPLGTLNQSGRTSPARTAADSTPNSRRAMARVLRRTPPPALHGVSATAPLCEEQKAIVRAVLGGASVFFTGSAGTGKSLVLRKIIRNLPADSTVTTAATGGAACHISGVTLHSFVGIGAGDASLQRCYELASRAHIIARWRKCTHLIVDEISMVDADYFTKMVKVAQYIRGNKLPCGGIQLVLSGDFLQLPPVSKGDAPKNFCFTSPEWSRCVQKTVMLRQVHRQSDVKFVQILSEIRLGRCSAKTVEVLQKTRTNAIERDGVLATQLCTHKVDAEAINRARLAALTGDEKSFEATDSLAIPAGVEAGAAAFIRVKVGAQVMLTKNLDLSKNMSNGSRGVVVSLSGYPLVRFAGGLTECIRPALFHVRLLSGVRATRSQLPLQLAWAISIHKSQGMSLDCVEMALGRAFEDGQAYVALSRVRSLAGVRVVDFTPACVRANAAALRFYASLDVDDGAEEHAAPRKRVRLSQHFR